MLLDAVGESEWSGRRSCCDVLMIRPPEEEPQCSLCVEWCRVGGEGVWNPWTTSSEMGGIARPDWCESSGGEPAHRACFADGGLWGWSPREALERESSTGGRYELFGSIGCWVVVLAAHRWRSRLLRRRKHCVGDEEGGEPDCIEAAYRWRRRRESEAREVGGVAC